MVPFLDIASIVLPVFVVIALGTLLRRLGLIDETFLHQANRLVYFVGLPLLLFHKIGGADFNASFNGALVAGTSIAIACGFALSYGYAALRRYPPATRGAFSQGAFRGNLAYVGLAMVFNAYGEEGLTRAGILMGFLVPVLNFFAIVALLLPRAAGEAGRSGICWWRQVALNPLIVASFAGIAWSLAALPFPAVVDRSLAIVTGLTLPMALLAIGGTFSLARLRGDLVRAGLATALKVGGMPLLAALLLGTLGVRGLDLAIGILMSAAPTATATYIMAQQMRSDTELAGSIIMLSTLLAAPGYAVTLFLLRKGGL